ncbi:MAG: asparagine synthase [Blastocatellia bacterium]|nr:asparagine synthase [Blastocatellia bacterium]
MYDHSPESFWAGIRNLPAGHKLTWSQNQLNISCWYDLASVVGDDVDTRPEKTVKEEYLALMKESVIFRFRSDVSVGINLSGGLDSSSLLGLVQEVQGKDNDVKAFTFITGDERYDELPWVEQMLEKTRHPLIPVKLQPEEIPALAASVQYHQDEPFSGIPTLAYAKLFETAKSNGVTVLLDGNGLDEQWCGYDYYQKVLDGEKAGIVQGTNDKPFKPECLTEEFRSLAEPIELPNPFQDKIRNLQYRDTFYTKIPRAMRFNDRISMRASTELREPFLDHRLFELAFRQPTERKLANGTRKKMLREIMQNLVPKNLTQAPKRPLQTPQREWLKGELFDWADSYIKNTAMNKYANWFEKTPVLDCWKRFCQGESDNSFYIWQWINIGLR